MTDLTIPPLGITIEAGHLPQLIAAIRENAKHAHDMLAPTAGEAIGKSLAICGAGWSLNDYLTETRSHDEVWACNSAVRFLKDRGAKVTHAFAIDWSDGMLDDWAIVYPDLTYLIASSVSPKLVAHLMAYHVPIKWFHNFIGFNDPGGWKPPDVCLVCQRRRSEHPRKKKHHAFQGMSYEMYLYKTLYRDTVQPQYGLNATVRALGVALNMGFNPIRLYGADCACKPDQPPMPSVTSPDYESWARQAVVYADGRTVLDVYGATGVVVEGQGRAFKGRRWHTRADMMISARHLTDMVHVWPHIELVGDTLPNALMDWTEKDWSHVPKMDGKGGIQGFRMHDEQRAKLAV